MARPKKGQEKNAKAGIAARLQEGLRDRIDVIINRRGIDLTVGIVEALEQWCDRHERAADRKGARK